MNHLLRVGVLSGVVLAVAGPSGRAVEPEAVNKAIEKGVTILRRTQAPNGTWPHTEIGATALAGLTLLECGAAADDRAVLRAADAVRQTGITLTHNYSIALTILFLDRLGDPSDIPLIEALTVRLLAGQTANGGWNYRSPPPDAGEVRRLQLALAQRRELPGRRELPKPGSIKRSPKDLPTEIQQQLVILHRMGMEERVVGSDNSNTQFGTLALWVGHRYGLPVEAALKRAEARFRSSQHTDGGWGYFEQGSTMASGPHGRSTASMTCAGLLALAISDGQKVEHDHDAKRAAKPARDVTRDPGIRRGLVALSSTIGPSPVPARGKAAGPVQVPRVGGRTYYFLWSLERVAVALDLKTIGKKDWYAWGADILLANQQEDGSWRGNFAECGADTCFALLFLKRANLAPDLTSQFTGKVADPGERSLRGTTGGERVLEGSISELKSGIEGKDAIPESERKHAASEARRKEAQPVAKPVAPPAATVKPADTAVGRMATDLVRATGSRHTLLLQQMRDGRGADFTLVLATAIPQLTGERQQNARDALIERLSRMTAETLVKHLEDEQAEIRRDAAVACARKKQTDATPKLVALLRDPQSAVAEAAHEALKTLSGRDFGPARDAGRDERDQAARKWLDWWNKQERK